MAIGRRHVGVSETIRYGYALGRVRALQAKLLPESTFRRLLSPPVLGEQKRVLSDTVYGGILDDAVTADDVERAFSGELLAVYADFLEGSRVPEPIMRFFRAESALEEERLALKLAAHDAREDAGSDVPVTPDVDARIDALRLEALRTAAEDSGIRMLRVLVERMVDHANLRIVVRAAGGARPLTSEARLRAIESLSDGGTVPVERYRDLLLAGQPDEQSLHEALPWTRGIEGADLLDRSRLDIALKRREIAALKEAGATPTGADPVIVYVLQRRIEIETLRSLIVATLAGADPDRLEKRIVVVG